MVIVPGVECVFVGSPGVWAPSAAAHMSSRASGKRGGSEGRAAEGRGKGKGKGRKQSTEEDDLTNITAESEAQDGQ
eukprot:128315-Rhodomonas_salina.1